MVRLFLELATNCNTAHQMDKDKDKHYDLLINLICNGSDHYHMECCLRYWLNTGSTLFFKAVLVEHCNCSLIVTQQASFCLREALRCSFLFQ